jgi:hypothetical protein
VHARVLHVELRQPLGEVGLHQVRRGHGLAVLRSLEFARDAILGNHHFRDLVLCEELLEFAVRHDLDGLRLLPPLLHDDDGEESEQQVADVELGALLHRVLGEGEMTVLQARIRLETVAANPMWLTGL